MINSEVSVTVATTYRPKHIVKHLCVAGVPPRLIWGLLPNSSRVDFLRCREKLLKVLRTGLVSSSYTPNVLLRRGSTGGDYTLTPKTRGFTVTRVDVDSHTTTHVPGRVGSLLPATTPSGSCRPLSPPRQTVSSTLLFLLQLWSI